MCWDQKMTISAKGKVDDQLATESYHLKEYKINQYMLQWRYVCMGLKWLQQQNEGNLRCTWIELDKY